MGNPNLRPEQAQLSTQAHSYVMAVNMIDSIGCGWVLFTQLRK